MLSYIIILFEMKVSVINGNKETLFDKILGRPFSSNLDKIEYTDNHKIADAILIHLHYLNCNQEFASISESQDYKKYGEKCFCLAMHDTPRFAYSDKICHKFICQPLLPKEDNLKYKIISIPLTMRHFEYKMTRDRNFITECRNTKKINNFCFFGQTGYASRDLIYNKVLPKFDKEITKPIWSIQNEEDRIALNKNFCKRLARSKYAFAPRGAGSSSFRAYQSMMSGTVPIISGMIDYPFSDEVDWSSFVITKNIDHISLLNKTDKEYEAMKRMSISFWDQYVDIENCDKILFNKYICGN